MFNYLVCKSCSLILNARTCQLIFISACVNILVGDNIHHQIKQKDCLDADKLRLSVLKKCTSLSTFRLKYTKIQLITLALWRDLIFFSTGMVMVDIN